VRIRQEDVDHVRQSVRIEDVIGEQLALKPAGAGSLKGLCPFHDERTPSFNVRPAVGRYHCFGCGEGGDVIDFVQKVDLLAFSDAVERLAARIGYQLRYEDDAGGRGPVRRDGVGTRQRLVEANRVGAQFFADQLTDSPDAGTGRQFLTDRGFDRDAAATFGVGFAPRSGEAALRHLRGKGFTEDELVASGLAGRGQRGLYDRFRGRLVWPIRDVTGDVVGFGARRLFDDDRIEAKYLNTPETAIYKKSQLLYGVDLAKKEIARHRQVVVVEGYTDVMACHLAGVSTAVATCGTAFGADHIRVVRRLLGDDALGGQVVFTFDGDEAGQKAALKAFEEDQRFVAQTSIAVAREGMDPCELRQRHGDEAVRELIAARTPLFEFAIRATIGRYDLNTAEGRVAGLRAAAPVVARIRDTSLRPEYARQLAGWLGMEIEPVRRAVLAAGRQPGANQGSNDGHRSQGRPAGARTQVAQGDPVITVERMALQGLLQQPSLIDPSDADLASDAFVTPSHRAVYDAICLAGGTAAASRLDPRDWIEQIRLNVPESLLTMIDELAISPLPADQEDHLTWLVTSAVLGVREQWLLRRQAELFGQLQRAEDGGVELSTRLQDLQRELTLLRQRRHTATGT
jgi:DNA primase